MALKGTDRVLCLEGQGSLVAREMFNRVHSGFGEVLIASRLSNGVNAWSRKEYIPVLFYMIVHSELLFDHLARATASPGTIIKRS